ncbi:MAG: histidinol-phosphate transaminase [Flavobacteriaceae bacterium]
MKNSSKSIIWNLDGLVRENVKSLQPYASARDDFKDFDKPMTYLDANENPFENGINRYPDPQQRELKNILASQKKVSAENILIGNGSDEVLDLLFRAFCEPNKDNVITLPPTYGMYSVLAGINAVTNKEILLTEDFQPNVNAILNKTDSNTKILFLCSPNNPTGNSFDRKKIEELLDNFPGLVAIDEAYIDFSDEPSFISSLNKYPNLVVTHTLSKAFGAAGIRVGICYASEQIVSVLNKIKPPYNSNALSQDKAIKVLKDKEEIKSQVAVIKKERVNLSEALLQFKFISKVYTSDANFLLIKVDDADMRYRQLVEKGFVVRNRSSQPLCENTLRITIGTPEENQKLIKALQQL